MPKAEKLSDGTYPAQTFPGCYPLYYVTQLGEVMCPKCANEDENSPESAEDPITHVEINYETYGLDCDVCYKMIPAAYLTEAEQLELRLQEK